VKGSKEDESYRIVASKVRYPTEMEVIFSLKNQIVFYADMIQSWNFLILLSE
jgi:hypothetical protein